MYFFYSVFKVQNISKTALAVLFKLVGLSGLEPPTSRLSGVRSNRLSYKPIWFFSVLTHSHYGGDEEDRTPDPLLAKQVLSQLSYTPTWLIILPNSQN